MSQEKSNYHPLFFTALLICAGLASPSNGLDDKTFKTPFEMLGIMVIAILVGVAAFSVWKVASSYGWIKHSSQKQKD